MQYRPENKGLEITAFFHNDIMIGFILRDLGISLHLVNFSFYCSWFNRKKHEEALERLKIL
jgi:hypothetical protein